MGKKNFKNITYKNDKTLSILAIYENYMIMIWPVFLTKISSHSESISNLRKIVYQNYTEIAVL